MAEDINLLRPTSPLSEGIVSLEKKLRAASIIVAATLLALAVVVGASYGFLSLQVTRLNNEKTQLLTRIAGESEKEALLVAVQSRIAVVGKVRAQTMPWGETLTLAQQIAQGGFITDANVGEQGRFTMTVSASSLDDAVLMVRTISQLDSEGTINAPILESLQLNESGVVHMSVSFVAVNL
jgi:hypothetical protein